MGANSVYVEIPPNLVLDCIAANLPISDYLVLPINVDNNIRLYLVVLPYLSSQVRVK